MRLIIRNCSALLLCSAILPACHSAFAVPSSLNASQLHSRDRETSSSDLAIPGDVFTLGTNCRHTRGKEQVTYNDLLTTYWADIHTLSTHAYDILNDVVSRTSSDRTGVQVRENLKTWFGLEFDPKTHDPPISSNSEKELLYIIDTFRMLVEILENRFAFPRGHDLKKNRYLFCNSNWNAETDKVFDAKTGRTIKRPGVNPVEILLVHDPNDYDVGQRYPDSGLDKLYKRHGRYGWQLYAFWCAPFKQYFYYPTKYGKMVNGHYCRIAGNLGLTFDVPFPPGGTQEKARTGRLTVSICPYAFGAQKGQVSKFFETSSDAIKSNECDRAGKTIHSCQPRSLTLLHELVHVVRTNDASPDNIGAVLLYGPDEVLKFAAKRQYDMSIYPEPYVFFAFALWMSLNPSPNGNDMYDWASGVAREQPPPLASSMTTSVQPTTFSTVSP